MSISIIRVLPMVDRGKKLTVKSGCRGIMVAIMILDKWRGTVSSQSQDWEARIFIFDLG